MHLTIQSMFHLEKNRIRNLRFQIYQESIHLQLPQRRCVTLLRREQTVDLAAKTPMSLSITTWEGNREVMDHTPRLKVIARSVILNLFTKPCLSLISEMSLLVEKAKEYERHISPSLRKSTRSWLESINEEFSEDQSSNEGENSKLFISASRLKSPLSFC